MLVGSYAGSVGSDENERARRHRRVQRAGVPGADPAPQRAADGEPVRAKEDDAAAWGGRSEPESNDERLKRDVPPHW
jgi:hypothetical protein